MADQITKKFADWAPLLKFIMEYRQLKEENAQLRDQIKHLETQVFGGTTK